MASKNPKALWIVSTTVITNNYQLALFVEFSLTLSLREITFYFSKNTRKWHPPQRRPRQRIFRSHPSWPFLPRYWRGLNRQPSPRQGAARATPENNADCFFCTFSSRTAIFHHDFGPNRFRAPTAKNKVVPKHPTHQQRAGALSPI